MQIERLVMMLLRIAMRVFRQSRRRR